MKDYSIIFLTSSISYPGYLKRMSFFKRLGVESKLLGFQQNLLHPSKEIPIKFELLGSIQNGNYLSRIKPMLTAVPKIREVITERDILYVFGFDMLLLALLAVSGQRRRPKIVYEVHDIRQIFMDEGFLGQTMRRLEKLATSRVNLLVVTSPAYISDYYENMLNLKDIHHVVIENKLDMNDLNLKVLPYRLNPRPLRVGYFGSLRCPYAWAALKKLAKESNGKVQIYVRGVPKGLETFKFDVNNIPGIEYGGPYLDPDDLTEIYGQVDIVWAAGYHGKSSFNWARSCRFYNACYFQRPIISLVETEEGKIVDTLKIGFCVDLKDIPGAVNRILKIHPTELVKWKENILRLPREVYVNLHEDNRLIDKILSIRYE